MHEQLGTVAHAAPGARRHRGGHDVIRVRTLTRAWMVLVGTVAYLRAAPDGQAAIAQIVDGALARDPRVRVRPATRAEVAQYRPALLGKVEIA